MKQGVGGAKKKEMISHFGLEQPYFSRDGTPVTVCSAWSDRLDAGCSNQMKLKWSGQDQDAKGVRVTVQPPVVPKETVIAPVFRIDTDSPDFQNTVMEKGYGEWWDCMEQVICTLIPSSMLRLA